MRLPLLLYVETNSGMPKRLSVTVSVPLLFMVSVPPNKMLKNASKGGTFNTGSGGEGGEDGGLLTVTPLEKEEVSPEASVSVAVMSGYVPVTVVVVVKANGMLPVLFGVTVSEPR